MRNETLKNVLLVRFASLHASHNVPIIYVCCFYDRFLFLGKNFLIRMRRRLGEERSCFSPRVSADGSLKRGSQNKKVEREILLQCCRFSLHDDGKMKSNISAEYS